MAVKMSSADEALIAKYKQDWANAATQEEKDAAHAAADAVRAKYGFSGGADGSQYIALSGSTGSNNYTPLNTTSANTKDTQDAYKEQVQKQNSYISANPSAVAYLPRSERQTDTGNAGTSGRYTYDQAEMSAALRNGQKVSVKKDANGQDVYYISDVVRVDREGESHADESLLSDADYTYVQYLKADFADNQSKYLAAMQAGQTELAAQYKAKMEQDHLEAERIRSGYGYSGGADGSMYINYTYEAAKGTMPAYTQSAQNFLDAKGMEYTLPTWAESTAAGKTQSAAAGTGAGSIGSVGSTAGGASAPGWGEYVNDYSSMLEQMYAARKEAALAELEAAYQQNVAAIDRAESGLAQSYQSARNQTAGASELAARNFAQYAAANGLNSGAGGQAELARNVTLQNNLSGINTAEAQSVADIQLQRANAETNYNNAIAQAQAEGDYQLAAALYQEKVRVDEELLDLAITQYQLEYQAYRDSVSDNQWQQSFDLSKAQQDWENKFAQTQYDNSQLQQNWENNFAQTQYNNALQQQEWENTLAKLKYDASVKDDTEMTLSVAKEMAQYGVFTEESLAVLQQNGFTQDYLKAKYGYKSEAELAEEALWAEIEKALAGASPAEKVQMILNGTTGSAFNQMMNNNAQHSFGVYIIDSTLAQMKAAGANLTEIRAALRQARDNGDLSQAEYEELSAKYITNGWGA